MTKDPDKLDVKIKKTDNFIYLESIVDQDRSSEMKIIKITSIGRKVIVMLNRMLWS